MQLYGHSCTSPTAHWIKDPLPLLRSGTAIMDYTNSKASGKVMNRKTKFNLPMIFLELTLAIRIRTQRVESIIRDS